MVADASRAHAQHVRAKAPSPAAAVLTSWRARTAVLIGAATLFRLLVVTTTGLANGEAYYYAWSRFPSWSYYDHPPLVAWMAWLTTRLSDADACVRLGPVICSAAAGALVFRLAERLFSPRAGFVAVVILTILPVFVVNSYALNPEGPMAPFWVLFLLVLDGMRGEDGAWRPVAAGAAAGLAFLAKYSGVLLLGVALACALASPVGRRWLRRTSFYAGALTSLLFAMPVILWNRARGWPSLTLHFVERRAPLDAATFVHDAGRVLLGQLGALHPLALPALLFVLAVAIRRARFDDRFRFLALASGPVLLFFYVVMLFVRDAESHWTMVGYIPLIVAAGGLLDEAGDRLPTAARWYLGVTAVSAGVAVVLTYAYSQAPALRALVPAAIYDPNRDVFNEMVGWDEVASTVERDAARLGPHAVVASCQYALCAHLSKAIDDRPPVFCPSAHPTEFDFLGRADPPTGAPVLYVTDDHYHDGVAERLPGRTCSPLPDVDVVRDGVPMQHYRLVACGPQAP